MLQSTTPRPTLHLATTAQPPSTTPKKPPFTQPRTLSGILHRNLSIPLLQTTTKLRFICITPAILPTMSPLLTLLRPIHRSSEVFLWMCWKITEIQDWPINHKCMSPISAKSRLLFLKIFFKKFLFPKIFKNISRKYFIRTFLLHTKFILFEYFMKYKNYFIIST